MASQPNLSSELQALIENAVHDQAAPGLVAVAFTRQGAFAKAAAGVRDIHTKAPMTLDTCLWFASAGKILVSLLTLIVVDKYSFDIDSVDALREVLPELAEEPINSLYDGKDEEGNYKYKPATKGITLRHILSHTSGQAAHFNSEEAAWMLRHQMETDFSTSQVAGCIRAFIQPRQFESGTGWVYGSGCEWLPVFIHRVTKFNLRQAARTLLFEPLGIDPNRIDVFRTPELDARRARLAQRDPATNTFGDQPIPIDTPQHEGDPPEGYSYLGGAPFHGEIVAMAQILQSLLEPDGPTRLDTGEPLLSKKVWQEALNDQLAELGVPPIRASPLPKSADAHWTEDLEFWREGKNPETDRGEMGWTLLQALVTKEESASGLKPGTIEWCGIANTYYFIDRSQGIGAIFSAQFMPLFAPKLLVLLGEIERWVVQNAAKVDE